MKVLQINPYPPENLGGSELFCKNLAIQLIKENIKCEILTSDFLKRDATIDFLENNQIKIYYKRCFFNLFGKNPIVNIMNFLKKNYKNYDIIHAHAYPFLTTIQSAIMKRFLKYPFILHLHGFDINPNLISGFNLFERFQLEFKNGFFDKFIGRIPIKTADAIISVSNRDLDIVKRKYKLNRNKCYYIPNCIDINKFKNNQNSKRIYITFIGRLSYIKGIDIFLDIIKIINRYDKNERFLIIGDGPLKNQVLNDMQFLPILYYPTYPYEYIQEVYNISKLLFITSRFEGLPTILLESLACETPVVSTNVGAVKEVIKHNRNGFIFNLPDMFKNILMILDLIHDQAKIKRFGKFGRETIERYYSWNTNIRKIISVYNSII